MPKLFFLSHYERLSSRNVYKRPLEIRSKPYSNHTHHSKRQEVKGRTQNIGKGLNPWFSLSQEHHTVTECIHTVDNNVGIYGHEIQRGGGGGGLERHGRGFGGDKCVSTCLEEEKEEESVLRRCASHGDVDDLFCMMYGFVANFFS